MCTCTCLNLKCIFCYICMCASSKQASGRLGTSSTLPPCNQPLTYFAKRDQHHSKSEQSLRSLNPSPTSKPRHPRYSPQRLGRPKRGSGNVIFWERDPAIWAERVLKGFEPVFNHHGWTWDGEDMIGNEP